MAETSVALEIETLLRQGLAETTDVTFKQQVINDVLSLIESTKRRIEQTQDVSQLYQHHYDILVAQGMEDRAAKATLAEARKDMNIKQLQNQALAVGLQGYETIMTIREILTGEKVIYQVGAYGTESKQKNSKIIEGSFTFAELEPMITAVWRSGEGFILYNNITQKGVRYATEQAGNEVTEISVYAQEVDQRSTLYSRMYKFYLDRIAGTEREKSFNWGFFYEAYRVLYAKSKLKNRYRPNMSTIAKTYWDIIKNNESFARGGDVLQMQVKASGSRLTTINTIYNQLVNVENALIALKNNNKNTLQYFNNVFIKQHPGFEAERIAVREAETTLKASIESLGYRVVT